MISLAIRIAIPALWLGWILYWIVAALNVKETRWHEPAGRRMIHGIPFILAFVLLVTQDRPWGVLSQRLVPDILILPALGTFILAAGLGYAVWARRHLGRNWSGTVSLKEDHALVRSGPYKYVRHPIYTGLLFGIIGTAVAIGEWRGLVAVALILFGILVRCRAEEKKMLETFPEYADYRRHSWALLPPIY